MTLRCHLTQLSRHNKQLQHLLKPVKRIQEEEAEGISSMVGAQRIGLGVGRGLDLGAGLGGRLDGIVLGVRLGVGGRGYDSGAGLRAELRPQILAGVWDEAGGRARNLGQTCGPRPWLEPE